MKFEIRPLRDIDMPQVQRIETACYADPWSDIQFLQELNLSHSHVDLCWKGEQLAGYLCYWLIAGELQILNIATDPKFQRQGVAQYLLKNAFDCCREQGLERTYLEVRVSNQAAIKLYRSLGFVEDGVRRGYYSDREDALLMVKVEPQGSSLKQ